MLISCTSIISYVLIIYIILASNNASSQSNSSQIIQSCGNTGILINNKRSLLKAIEFHPILLKCTKDASNHHNNSIYGEIVQISSKLLPNDDKKCPVSYDTLGNPRTALHLCKSSSQDFYCHFNISNVIITNQGGLLDCKSLNAYSFNHPSMKGKSIHGISCKYLTSPHINTIS